VPNVSLSLSVSRSIYPYSTHPSPPQQHDTTTTILGFETPIFWLILLTSFKSEKLRNSFDMEITKNRNSIDDIPETFWAYLAGLVDGEGCVQLKKTISQN
jgi:hypothetical protein